MIPESCSHKLIAACAAIAILCSYSMVVWASPGASLVSGQLVASGVVTIDGENVISGTVFSDSLIVTEDNSSATLNLSKLGRVELVANSALRLSFTETNFSGFLDSGSAQISTLPGVAVSLKTKDGVVSVDGREATWITVNVIQGVTSLVTHSGNAQLQVNVRTQVAPGEGSLAAMPQGTSNRFRPSGGALAALLLAAGGAIAAAIILATRDNDLDFGGNPLVISPTR